MLLLLLLGLCGQSYLVVEYSTPLAVQLTTCPSSDCVMLQTYSLATPPCDSSGQCAWPVEFIFSPGPERVVSGEPLMWRLTVGGQRCTLHRVLLDTTEVPLSLPIVFGDDVDTEQVYFTAVSPVTVVTVYVSIDLTPLTAASGALLQVPEIQQPTDAIVIVEPSTLYFRISLVFIVLLSLALVIMLLCKSNHRDTGI